MKNSYNLKRNNTGLAKNRIKPYQIGGILAFGDRKRPHSANYFIQKNFKNIQRDRFADDILRNQLEQHDKCLHRLLNTLNISVE